MAWNYAELSKAAKEVGGPEKLVSIIEENGKAIGRKEMVPFIGVAVLGTIAVIKLNNYFKAKRAISQEAAEKAKAELIKGIKEYDATHPENLEDNTSENGGLE